MLSRILASEDRKFQSDGNLSLLLENFHVPILPRIGVYMNMHALWLIPLTQVTPYPPPPHPSGLAGATDAQLHGRRSILNTAFLGRQRRPNRLSRPLWRSPESTG